MEVFESREWPCFCWKKKEALSRGRSIVCKGTSNDKTVLSASLWPCTGEQFNATTTVESVADVVKSTVNVIKFGKFVT